MTALDEPTGPTATTVAGTQRVREALARGWNAVQRGNERWHAAIQGEAFVRLGDVVLPPLLLYTTVWLLQWWLAPHWLVDSRATVADILELLPTAVLALLAIGIAAFFVIAQQSAMLYRGLAATVLARDNRVVGNAMMLVGVAVISLLLSALVPESGAPPALTAGVTTLLLAFGIVALGYPRLLTNLMDQYNTSWKFMPLLRNMALHDLEHGRKLAFRSRLQSIEQATAYAVAAHDPQAVFPSINALTEVHRRYVERAAAQPQLRRLYSRTDNGIETYFERPVADATVNEGWIGDATGGVLVDAVLAGCRNGLPMNDVRLVVKALYDFAKTSVEAGYEEDAEKFTDRLGQLATTEPAIARDGLFVRDKRVLLRTPAAGLADLEWLASRTDGASLPEQRAQTRRNALANWALAVAFAQTRGEDSCDAVELVAASHRELSKDPPWSEAAALLERWSPQLASEGIRVLEQFALPERAAARFAQLGRDEIADIFRATGERARLATEEGDPVALLAALRGLPVLYRAFARAAAARPELRWPDGGLAREWCGTALGEALAKVLESAVRTRRPRSVTREIASAHYGVARAALAARHEPEAARLVESLARLIPRSFDFAVDDGAIKRAVTTKVRRYAPVTALADLEYIATLEGIGGAAARALAGWAVGVAFAGAESAAHPFFDIEVLEAKGRKELSPSPPWEEAKDVLAAGRWAWAGPYAASALATLDRHVPAAD